MSAQMNLTEIIQKKNMLYIEILTLIRTELLTMAQDVIPNEKLFNGGNVNIVGNYYIEPKQSSNIENKLKCIKNKDHINLNDAINESANRIKKHMTQVL